MTIDKRPFWQAEPCPKWCRSDHNDDDLPDDRFHIGDSFSTSLTMERAVEVTKDPKRYANETFEAELFQGYREREPHVTLGFSMGNFGVSLTLKEAERLAYILGSLGNIARDTDDPECVSENLDDEEQWR